MSTARRRWRFALTSAVVLAGVLAIAVLANVLAARFPLRFDASSAGDQQLAPRTRRLLAPIDAPHTIVVAAPLAQLDHTARDRVLDVLADFHRANPKVDSRVIDTGSPVGVARYADLVRELADRDRATLDAQASAIRGALDAGRSLAAYLATDLSERLLAAGAAARDAGPLRDFLESTAAASRVSSRDVAAALDRADRALASTLGDVPVPATADAAAELTRVLAPAAEQLAALAAELRKRAPDAPPPARDALGALAADLDSRRDTTARALDPVLRLKKPDILRVTNALQNGSGVIVIGPKAIGAVDLAQLFPSPEWLAASGLSGADLGRRAEEILSTALASISGPKKPVVVFLHADPRPVMLSSGVFAQVVERLQMRGIDALEWACVSQPEPPDLPKIRAADRDRSVVYVTFAPDTSAGAQATSGSLNGAQRAAKLGAAIDALLEQGQPVLLSLNPSVLPTFGDADPLVTPLARFGLSALSGKPLLSQLLRAGSPRPLIDPSRRLTPTPGEHPIARAIATLPTQLAWCVHLQRASAPAGVSVVPLLTFPPDESTWAESQWIRFWQTKPADQPLLPDPPAFDQGKDLRSPPEGEKSPWVVALAAERRDANASRRVVVVGSNGWYADAVAMTSIRADGRQGAVSPGNIELLESAVFWLAGQDELIAQSATARSLPRVVPMPDPSRAAWRWGLIVGLPALVLALGFLRRLVLG